MSNSRIKLNENKGALILHRILTTDNVGLMVQKLNQNFDEIINNGGGAIGPPGPIGIGCRGSSGSPGIDGENVLDEWNTAIGIGCNNEEINNINDCIFNKHVNKTLLLSNIVFRDNTYEIKNISDDDITSPIISEEFNDYKVKIYNSNINGENGKHIHLMNSKAITIDKKFLCKSGFTFDLNLISNTTEKLKISGQKNSEILNHKHIVEIIADSQRLKQTDSKQTLELNSGSSTNNFVGTLNQKPLTNNRDRDIPDRTGYIAILQDTLEHGETWEVLNKNKFDLSYVRYSINDLDESKEENQYIYVDENSEIKFKRLNSFILVDFHIGIRRIEENDDFFIKNLQFKVNIPTLGARTIGWYPFSVLASEDFEDDSLYTDFGYFKLTPTDVDDDTNNTFLLSLKFRKNEKLPFISSRLEDTYWLSGQIWATEITEDPSCIEVTIDQENVCPYLEITN